MDQYGSLVDDQTKSLLKARGNEALGYSKQKMLELKKYAEDGNWSWKVAGFIGGLMIIGVSLMSIMSNLFGLSPFRAVLNIYLFFFGLSMCIMEFKEKALTQQYLDLIKREALFLYHPYGRAAFYFFVGILIACEGGLLGLLVGAYCAVVGVFIFQSSQTAFKQLDAVRSQINESDVDSKFAAFDKDSSGYLDSHELGALVRALGANMTVNELESALFILDKNGDGRISLQEFKRWWCNQDDFVIINRV